MPTMSPRLVCEMNGALVLSVTTPEYEHDAAPLAVEPSAGWEHAWSMVPGLWAVEIRCGTPQWAIAEYWWDGKSSPTRVEYALDGSWVNGDTYEPVMSVDDYLAARLTDTGLRRGGLEPLGVPAEA